MLQPDYQDIYERLCQRAPLALHALKSAILRAEELLAQAHQHAAGLTKQPGWEKLTEDEQKRAMKGAYARIDDAKKAQPVEKPLAEFMDCLSLLPLASLTRYSSKKVIKSVYSKEENG